MSQAQSHCADGETNKLSPDDPSYMWLQDIARRFFARNGVTAPPEILVQHEIEKASSGSARFQGPIIINASELEALYQHRAHSSEHSLECLLGHEYHHVVSDKNAAEDGKNRPLASNFLPALLSCLAAGLAWFNLPGKYRLGGTIASATTTMFFGDSINRNQQGRIEEIRADLRGIRMALHGMDTKEAQLKALDNIGTQKVFTFEANVVSNILCFLSGYPSTHTRNQQLQLIRNKVEHTSQPKDVGAYIEEMDQNLIKMSRNPLTISY